MRKVTFTAACCVLSSCATTSYRTTSDFVPVARGSLESFAPLVPASDAGPRCEDRVDARVEPGQRAVAMVFSGPSARQVTVTLNTDGEPARYTDVRGDLTAGDGHAGDRTTIGLYLEADYAVLSNRVGDAQPTILEVPLAEALEAEELGDPSAVLEWVLETCAQDD